MGSAASALACLKLCVGGICLCAVGLSEACAAPRPSELEFCWLDLIQFPNCQSLWVTAGADVSAFTELLIGGCGGSSIVLSLSDSDLELVSESLELADSTSLECASAGKDEELCWRCDGSVVDGRQFFCPGYEETCPASLAGNGDLEGSSVQGVWMVVRRGGHEWVISLKMSSTQCTSCVFVSRYCGSVFFFPWLDLLSVISGRGA